jgi:putative flippase GtrA
MEANPSKLILGVRDFDGDSVPNKSKFGNKLTRFVCKALCGVKVSDTQTGLRGIPVDFMRDLLECPGERFEFETRMLVQTKDRYEIVEVEIETIYDSKENHSTHFDPLKDSIRIYKIFGAMFIRFLISSLSSSALDLWLFYMFCSALRGMNMELYVAIATVTARIISAIYNYLINYRVVFRSNAKHGRTAVRYFALAVVQMLCSAGIVTCLVGTLNVQTELVVKIPVDVLLFFVSYMIQREFVYKDNR